MSSPDSYSSILATAAKGEGSTKASLSLGKGASYSRSAIGKEITATSDIPPQLPSPLPVVEDVIEGPSTRSLNTVHIEHRPPDANLVEHTPSRDVEAPSSPPPILALNDSPLLGMLLPLDSSIRSI